MGNKFQPSKDYDVSIIHKGSKLGADDEIFPIFPIFQRSLLIMYHYIIAKKMKGVVNYY